ncbi:AAA-like domain-containing protein [Paraferrimonas sedimenticola]|uniref:vWA-MoxR associated protein N-terminal HTH domain-containing protein n=1 Tax=Paraferrimonas sedimenticola TaxID=375674 RepID=A0AA37RXY4_9GAMM|nr:AAA-like domain-containing protein [Paraferrimonas sedimenticola]GLP97260.1 hypothetical protein GCM10007895_25670 [Paraferrimonas sedimenticola]
MNHQEAKDLLKHLLPEDTLSLIKVEVFRLSWEGKGYNIIAEETGYDHDYVRKSGSILWQELSELLDTSVTKRNFRPLLESQLEKIQHSIQMVPDYPGAPMVFSSPHYVERTEEEQQAYHQLQQPGALIRVKGPRKMGKSSLMLRMLDHADELGYRQVTLDFQMADSSILKNLDKLLRWTCLQMTSQLGLEDQLESHWNELIGPKLSCSNYIKDYILSQVGTLVVAINEVNLIFDHQDVSRDFLALLRSWHEEAKHNPSMQKLRQLLIYSTEVYVQLDLNLSPFNVGLPIELRPFDDEQLSRLATSYGFNWPADGSLQSPIRLIQTHIGGHPYLTQLVFYRLVTQEGFIESPSEALAEILKSASAPNGLFSDYLQHILVAIMDNQDAMSAFRKLRKSADAKLSRIEMYQLESLGVVRLRSGQATTSCKVIADFLAAQIG